QKDRERQIERHQPPRQRLEIAHPLGVIRRDTAENRFRTRDLGDDRVSHCSPPAAIFASARGACPACANKMQRRPGSVIALALLPFPPARAGPAPFAPTRCSGGPDQSLLSPCCHFRRCSPNQEIRIAASKNGIMAVAM